MPSRRPTTRIATRRTLTAVVTMLLGALCGQGLVIAISPMLTRTYGPTDFGALAVVTAVASIIGAGATLGTDRAVAVSSGESTRALVWIGAGAASVVACVLTVVSWCTRSTIAHVFAAPVLVELWWIIPVTTWLIALQRLASAVLARRERHTSIALRNAMQGVGQTAWNLGAAAFGPLGLVGGLGAGRLLALVGLVRPGMIRSSAVSSGACRRAASRHRRFLLLTPWSAMLNVVGQQAPSLLLAAAHGSAAAGYISLTMRVLGAPVGIIADAVAQFVAGRFGARIRDRQPVRGLLVRIVFRLLAGGAVAAGLVIGFGPGTFRLLFGPDWAVAGDYARVLAPAFAVQVAVSPVTQVLSMLGKQAQQLGWDIARLVLTSGAVLVASLLGASTIAVLAALSASMIVAYLSMLVLVLRATRAHVDGSNPPDDAGPLDRSTTTSLPTMTT